MSKVFPDMISLALFTFDRLTVDMTSPVVLFSLCTVHAFGGKGTETIRPMYIISLESTLRHIF